MESIVRSMGILLVIQVIFIILSAFLLRYEKEVNASLLDRDRTKGAMAKKYSMFQDVQVMIFIGFGFLMTFLKKYGFSSVGFSFLLTAVIIQWSIFCHGVFHISSTDYKIHIDIENLLNADIATAASLISMGAVLGRTTPIQLILMGLIQTMLFAVNEYIQKHLKVTDVGGSMVVHVFGAYFGLAVSKILGPPKGDNLPESSSSTSDMFAMIGTIFLWVFWPSFNSALANGDEQHRAVINTYLSLAACCVTAYALSALLSEHRKFDMVHIQNSTLAGGVAIGTSADLMVQPYGALLVGTIAAAVSVSGYVYLTPFLLRKFKLHDTCGVHNLHGMPGVLAGVVGALASWLASQKEYGYSLFLQFPARAPLKDTELLNFAQHDIDTIVPGENRTALEQAGYQLLVLLVTLVIATVGGSITGVVIQALTEYKPLEMKYFEDDYFWRMPEVDCHDEKVHMRRFVKSHDSLQSIQSMENNNNMIIVKG